MNPIKQKLLLLGIFIISFVFPVCNLFALASISGKVIDSTTAQTLQGVRIQLLEALSGTTIQETVTNVKGMYEFRMILPGQYKLQAEFADYVAVSTNPAMVTIANSPIRANFSLGIPGAFEGKVTEIRTNLPIKNASINVLRGNQIIASTLTDEYGYYFFKNLAPRPYVVKVTVPSFDPISQLIAISSTQNPFIEFKFPEKMIALSPTNLSEFYNEYFESSERALGMPPLCYALEKSYFSISILLVEKDKSIVNDGYAVLENKKTMFKTPLAIAIQNQQIEIILSLIKAGADLEKGISLKNSQNVSPLAFAIDCGFHVIVDLLLSNGADPNVQSGYDCPVINLAAMRGMLQTVMILLDFGADPLSLSSRDCSLLTSLLWNSSSYSDEEAIALINRLISMGVDPNLITSNGSSPLHGALLSKKQAIFMHLIELGANPKNPLLNPNILVSAIQANQRLIVEYLLSQGSDPNIIYSIPFPQGNWNRSIDNHRSGAYSLLSWTLTDAKMNDYAELLLEQGADPNIKDSFGDTSVFKTIIFHNPAGLKLLLRYKPDLWVVDKDGYTAMDLAVKLKEWEIYELLIEELANR